MVDSNIKLFCCLVWISTFSINCKQIIQQTEDDKFDYSKFITFKNNYDSVYQLYLAKEQLNNKDKQNVTECFDSLERLIFPKNSLDSSLIINNNDSIIYATFKSYKKSNPRVTLTFPQIDAKDTREYVKIPYFFGGKDSMFNFIKSNINKEIFAKFANNNYLNSKVTVSFTIQKGNTDSIKVTFKNKTNEGAFLNELCRIFCSMNWQYKLTLLDSNQRVKIENREPFEKKYQLSFSEQVLLSIDEFK